MTLPEWVLTSPDFDPDRWHLPFICTHKELGMEDGRPPSFLTLLLEHPDHGVGWLPTVHAAGEHFPPTDDQFARANKARRATNNRGSVNVTCPECHRTRRYPRQDWTEALAFARSVEAPWLDLATLV